MSLAITRPATRLTHTIVRPNSTRPTSISKLGWLCSTGSPPMVFPTKPAPHCRKMYTPRRTNSLVPWELLPCLNGLDTPITTPLLARRRLLWLPATIGATIASLKCRVRSLCQGSPPTILINATWHRLQDPCTSLVRPAMTSRDSISQSSRRRDKLRRTGACRGRQRCSSLGRRHIHTRRSIRRIHPCPILPWPRRKMHIGQHTVLPLPTCTRPLVLRKMPLRRTADRRSRRHRTADLLINP